ncbi:hypothetical protein [Rhodopirellula sallentina]|uniref:Uncharacterized protein n=1 Tax=Rhodopirellula sallentina SM41 TaxID=1263870 RepID=M5U1Y1_9BACT|nr:hypothetical protein [Rhodopirellula sallentina]EMI55445.1 hypothetical protein RSSM_03088 [Rhodopirellula sallentina SM41]
MTTISGASNAAQLLDRTRSEILQRCNNAVTLSRSTATEAIFEAWQATNESWKLGDDENAISEEVRDTAIQFVESLPLGFPLPEVTAEPDGHINLEWYREPRRVVSVSIASSNRLFWAALIGTESPRGTVRFIDSIPVILLDQIARVFEG